MRRELKEKANALEAMERYTVIKEYGKGGTFGELALLENQPR